MTQSVKKLDQELYFKGMILPKEIANDPLIDLENNFFLCDERKQNISFSHENIYQAIKEQKPELLKLLSKLNIKDYEKNEFEKLLEKDGISTSNKKQVQIDKFDSQTINNFFNALNKTLKLLYNKEANLYKDDAKIDIENKEYYLGWFKLNDYEIYMFSDMQTTTHINNTILSKSNKLEKNTNQDILKEYKKFITICKGKLFENKELEVKNGASKINNNILEKYFSKNPKYYLIELDTNTQDIQFYITLKKVNNG